MRGVVLILAMILSWPVLAMEVGDAKPPTQEQLTHLLSGNTVTGEWDGRPFIQFFSAKGITRYREGNGPASQGTWRVNSAGQYCSVWPPSSTEVCYDVLVKGRNLLWKSGDKIHPSEVESDDTF